METTALNTKELENKVNLSNLMKAAWALVKKLHKSMSEAMKMAWKAMKLRQEMMKHAVHFQYRKANGEIRNAIGILTNVPYESKHSNRKPCYTCIAYWDLEKNAFRSFTMSSLL